MGRKDSIQTNKNELDMQFELIFFAFQVRHCPFLVIRPLDLRSYGIWRQSNVQTRPTNVMAAKLIHLTT